MVRVCTHLRSPGLPVAPACKVGCERGLHVKLEQGNLLIARWLRRLSCSPLSDCMGIVPHSVGVVLGKRWGLVGSPWDLQAAVNERQVCTSQKSKTGRSTVQRVLRSSLHAIHWGHLNLRRPVPYNQTLNYGHLCTGAAYTQSPPCLS